MAAPTGSLPDLRLLGLFGAGAVLLRGAGCTVNDMWDMQLDALVARTRSRPLASGALKLPQAVGECPRGASCTACLQINTMRPGILPGWFVVNCPVCWATMSVAGIACIATGMRRS